MGDNRPTTRPADVSGPLLVAVDDAPALLRDLERELRNRYEPDYRVRCLCSAGEALSTLEELAAAGQSATTPAATTAPLSPPDPTPTPTPTVSEAATTPEVPATFVDAMVQIGIPLDPHTGWVVAQGICVRLGQPQYDQFRMSEGVERLFPSVPDEQAHQFVAMVAESVCGL